MRVKILKSSNNLYWYSNAIGNTFEVFPTIDKDGDYKLVNSGWFVKACDCTPVIENPKHYQSAAARTLVDKPGFDISDKDIMAIWCSVGLSGESGEVAELLKKGIFHQHGIDEEKLKKELGDVCWYLAGLCTVYGFELTEVMQMNIDKLIERYPNGYNSEDSKKRVDTQKYYKIIGKHSGSIIGCCLEPSDIGDDGYCVEITLDEYSKIAKGKG